MFLPVPPFHRSVVVDGDLHAVTQLALLNLRFLVFAPSCLAASAASRSDLWERVNNAHEVFGGGCIPTRYDIV